MRETGSDLRIGCVRDRGEERPSGGPNRASTGPGGAMQRDDRPPPIIRLTSRPSYTPISTHHQISHELSLSLLLSRAPTLRPRFLFARCNSDAGTGIARCTGVYRGWFHVRRAGR